MKKVILGTVFAFMLISLIAIGFANRDIETTDVLVVHDTYGEDWKVRWSAVETFIEDNVDTITGDLTLSGETTFGDDAIFDSTVTLMTELHTQGINFGSLSGGTADSLYIDFTPDLPDLAAGLIVEFVADSANTGAVTITIDGTEKDVYEASDVSGLEADDIGAGMFVSLRYDGTQWQQISQSGN